MGHALHNITDNFTEEHRLESTSLSASTSTETPTSTAENRFQSPQGTDSTEGSRRQPLSWAPFGVNIVATISGIADPVYTSANHPPSAPDNTQPTTQDSTTQPSSQTIPTTRVSATVSDEALNRLWLDLTRRSRLRDFMASHPQSQDPFLPCNSMFMYPSGLVLQRTTSNIEREQTREPNPFPPVNQQQQPSSESHRREEATSNPQPPPFIVTQEVYVEDSGDFSESVPPSTTTSSSHSWRELYNPAEISVIDNDAGNQPGALPPFSDPYIAGCPDHKRRMQEQTSNLGYISREASESFIEFMNQNVPSNVNLTELETTIRNDLEIQRDLNTLLNETVDREVDSRSDVDPENHPKCAKIKKEK